MFHIHKNKRFKTFEKTLGLNVQLSMFTADCSRNASSDSRPGSPCSAEHIPERRERQFDLVFETPPEGVDSKERSSSPVPVLKEREPLLFPLGNN